MFAALLAAVMLSTVSGVDFGITDEAHLLEGRQEAFTQKLQQIKDESNVRVGLLTLNQLNGDAKATAVRAVNQWALGPRSVVVLVSLNPKKVFIQPGSALALTFNHDFTVGLIQSYMVPSFRSGNYAEGIMEGLNGIRLAVKSVPQARLGAQSAVAAPVPEPVVTDGGHPVRNFFLFLLLGGAVLFLGRTIFRSRRERLAREAAERETYARQAYTSASHSHETYNQAARRAAQPVSVSTAPAAAASAAIPSQASTTVINNTTGGNGLGSGGFVEGMLVGEMLSRPATVVVEPSVVHHREVVVEESPSYSSSYDSDAGSGGGGSSWSDDSSSGGGSSYSSDDSGGGSDFGGGDSGGGSDW